MRVAKSGSFYPCDYMGNPGTTEQLKANVSQRIFEHNGDRFEGKVYVLTQMRRLGFVFNPVSFYFCFDQTSRRRYIVSEIENTPWGERFSYVHEIPQGENSAEFVFDKDFHVSPFLPMDIKYVWKFSLAGHGISVSMDCLKSNTIWFSASLALVQKRVGERSLDRFAFQNIFLTMKIVALIYYQALKLWMKRVPFFEHPEPKLRKGW